MGDKLGGSPEQAMSDRKMKKTGHQSSKMKKTGHQSSKNEENRAPKLEK